MVKETLSQMARDQVVFARKPLAPAKWFEICYISVASSNLQLLETNNFSFRYVERAIKISSTFLSTILEVHHFLYDITLVYWS